MASEHEVLEQQFNASVERLQRHLRTLTVPGTKRQPSALEARGLAVLLFDIEHEAKSVALRARHLGDSVLEPFFPVETV